MQHRPFSVPFVRSTAKKLVVLSVFLFQLTRFSLVESARIRLGPAEEEPTTRQVYNNYRVVFADPNYYHLRQVGALEESQISRFLRDDQLVDEKGNYEKFNFQFNSSEYIRKDLSASWYYLWMERLALHVYDDKDEMLLASGPQVDQQLCGLHLDYMLHMVKKHLKRIDKSTEISIYKLMQAFDSPRQGLPHGTSVFPGDFDICATHKLNVIRIELEQVDKVGAKMYFSKRDKQQEVAEERNKPSNKMADLWHNYLKPFFGFHKANSVSSISIANENARDKFKLLPMRYCMAGLRWPDWSNTSWARRHVVLRTGACLPETCDSNSLSLHYEKIRQLVEFQLTKFHDNFYIENLYCLPDEQSKFRNPLEFTSTTLFLAFNLIWFSLLVGSTLVYHFAYRGRGRKRRPTGYKSWWLWLRCWCVTRNLRSFLSAGADAATATTTAPADRTTTAAAAATTATQESPDRRKRANTAAPENGAVNKLNLAPLEGFKVLSSLSVMTSHSVILVLATVWNCDERRRLLSDSWLALVFTVCPAIVDNFFVTTGALMARSLLKSSRRHFKSPGFWFKFCAYRYMRIIPLYLLTSWFLQTTFRFLGSGPFWDYGTSHSSWSKICQSESLFWRIVLPTANFISPSIHCDTVGWYLANDLQFTLLACILMPLIFYKPLIGHSVNFVLILAGILEHVRYFFVYDPDPRGAFEWNPMIMTRITDDTMTGYVSPQYRYVAFLVGLSAGHALDAYERGVITQWPKKFVRFGKSYIFLTIYLLVFGVPISSLVLDLSDHNIRLIGAIFQGTSHGLAALASAIFILLLTSGQHFRQLGRFMGARLFHPMANMALSTSLIHMPIMFYQYQILRALPHLTAVSFHETNLLYIVESFFAAAVVHVLYELPLRNVLIKLLFKVFASNSTPAAEPQQKKSDTLPGDQVHMSKSKTQ